MAGIASAAQFIGPLVQGVNLVSALTQTVAGKDTDQRRDDLALQQLKEQQALSFKNAQQDAALQRQQIALNAEAAEDARRSALKRAVARQRASFGSSGIEQATSGSAQAVLLGLFDESEDERLQREKLDQLRLTTIDQNLTQRRRNNVLQQSQLKQQLGINSRAQRNSFLASLPSTIDQFGKTSEDIADGYDNFFGDDG